MLKRQQRQNASILLPGVSWLFALVLFFAPPATAQPPAPTSSPPQVSATELNQAIDNVIHRAEFTWRLPRQARPPADDSNWFVRTTQRMVEAVTKFIRQLGRWFA